MQTASRDDRQLAHAAGILANAPAYARRSKILLAASDRIRYGSTPRRSPLQFPQARVNDAAARAERIARIRQILTNYGGIATALLIAAGVTLAIGHATLKTSLNIDATLAQAQMLRGM